MPPVRSRIQATALLLVALLYAVFSSVLIFRSRLSTSANLSLAVATTSDAPSKHNKRSTTSYMWHRGEPFNPLEENRPPDSGHNITIDALSIGTQYNVPQMEGQAKSWASHWSVRYLFGTTERDDADPACHERFTQKQFDFFFQTCSHKQYNDNPLRPIRARFPISKWIEKENKTIGWLCAQQRFAHAVGKVGRFYRREGGEMPDFLFIQDDDTWYGMNQMVSFLSTRNHSTPFTTAGCMIQWPVHFVNFSFPYGGYGTVLNRLSVERLIKPIYCNRTTMAATSIPDDQHTKRVCLQLEENLAGERMAFREGFSISDLMDRHAAMLPYRRYKRWKNDPGYCMLGDWVLGYYINYYELGSREDPSLEYIHMDHSLGYDYSKRVGSCQNDGVERCWESDTKYACHRIPPDTMLSLHANDARNQRANKTK
jgi:hypothetical protein